MLLIVTSKDDSHADALIARLNATGRSASVVRLNTEDFAGNVRFSITENGFRLQLADSGRQVSNEEIRTVWYRRPKDIQIAAPPESEGYGEFALSQLQAALRGIYFLTHDTARWINPLPALHRARIKLQQLALARELGLRPPATLATNDPAAALAFGDERRLCVKSLDAPYGRAGAKLVSLFTCEVTAEQLAGSARAIEESGVYLQELIEKEVDVRVLLFGETLRAYEIHSQANGLSRIDFRGASPDLLEQREHVLPPIVAERLRRFARRQGLASCSFDLVLDRRGDYVFIENNPNGQWLWLQDAAGEDLLELFIRFLLDRP